MSLLNRVVLATLSWYLGDTDNRLGGVCPLGNRRDRVPEHVENEGWRDECGVVSGVEREDKWTRKRKGKTKIGFI